MQKEVFVRRAGLGPSRPWLAVAVAAIAIFSLAGCGKSGATAAPAASGGTAGDIPEVLATIGDEKITLADIRERTGSELDLIETQYQRARHRTIETALNTILRERVLEAEARRQNKSVQDLVAAEAGPGLDPADVEISAWYQENQARIGNRPMDATLRQQIADFLRDERLKAASDRLEQRLNRERQVTVNYQPFRMEFDHAGAATKGNPNAKVTLVEFSDFQCPFCERFVQTLKQVERTFGDSVYIVYRHFPLTNIHPFAYKAAEASMCANEQGRFWQMHDLLFAEQQRMSVADLKEKGRRVGLDANRFNTCLDSGKYAELVQKDMQEGTRAGVNGTPALFVNGQPVEGGAVAFETLAAVIRRELDKTSSN